MGAGSTNIVETGQIMDTSCDTNALVPYTSSCVSTAETLRLQIGKTYRIKTDMKNALCLNAIA